MVGRFIVFEGIDGAGKSTLIEGLSKSLSSRGIDIVSTAEPTEGPIGRMIRSGTVRKVSQNAEALLFTADRACHTQEILEWKESGKTVLCDRYYASTIAYQSTNLEGTKADKEWLKEINRPIIIEPDITFLLDIDPEMGMERVNGRGDVSKFEVTEYLKKVRSNYLEMAKESNFHVIDASGTEEEVLAEAIAIIGE
ncbi:MAG TPA: dTMP kinase [Candidatus Methanomethylophilaceae archaeon]|nr:dTMP kinase [Candidatus Methanomethylophilaceae archaeon]